MTNFTFELGIVKNYGIYIYIYIPHSYVYDITYPALGPISSKSRLFWEECSQVTNILEVCTRLLKHFCYPASQSVTQMSESNLSLKNEPFPSRKSILKGESSCLTRKLLMVRLQ